jgi:GNAT superfamily N-acetyltransferase
MDIKIREAKDNDVTACGRICYEAFHTVATEHNFPPDFPNTEAGVATVAMMISHPGFHGVVAELDGKIAGSNFLDERSPISGVGPISVDPHIQNQGIGRRLMLEVMERSEQRGFAGIRLLQAGYHCRSLSLYTKLGFDPREHISCFQGPSINDTIPGYNVRAANQRDIDACNRLCIRVHGHHRGGEVRDAVAAGTASVVERAGRITGYATQIAYFAHAVAETNDDLQGLISAATSFGGPGFLVPSRNGALMRWCLGKGLRVTQPATLMTMGLYNEPSGAYLPSILY